MKRRLAIVSLLMVSGFVSLPSYASASPIVRETSLTAGSGAQIRMYVAEQPGRRRWRRAGYWNHRRWYKNYGQYRRTQVGWRRYRMTPRYYWRDGRRYQTYRRVYYYNNY